MLDIIMRDLICVCAQAGPDRAEAQYQILLIDNFESARAKGKSAIGYYDSCNIVYDVSFLSLFHSISGSKHFGVDFWSRGSSLSRWGCSYVYFDTNIVGKEHF